MLVEVLAFPDIDFPLEEQVWFVKFVWAHWLVGKVCELLGYAGCPTMLEVVLRRLPNRFAALAIFL